MWTPPDRDRFVTFSGAGVNCVALCKDACSGAVGQRFVAKHPVMRVELVLPDRPVDLIEEGLDVGIRIGALPDSSLVAVPVGATRRVVCASPACLRRRG
jgi:DNA-binding transcriptional LysR family regulator